VRQEPVQPQGYLRLCIPKISSDFYVKAGATRRLIIQYLIDHLDRCMALPAATPAEIED
jgi:hypothetical protein